MNDTLDFRPGRAVAELPPINARFYVPRLADKPQNPIMDTLKLLDDLNAPPVQPTLLLRREAADRAANEPPLHSSPTSDVANLWRIVCDNRLLHKV